MIRVWPLPVEQPWWEEEPKPLFDQMAGALIHRNNQSIPNRDKFALAGSRWARTAIAQDSSIAGETMSDGGSSHDRLC
jgi:hypothetical protein